MDKVNSPLTAELIREVGASRDACERELDEAGFPLLLQHRAAWARAARTHGSWFLALREPGGRCAGGFAIEVARARALPGHLRLRVERFGGNLLPGVCEAAVAGLADLARRDCRVLSVNVELLVRDAETRTRLESLLQRSGFRPEPNRRRYARTAAVDLTPDEAALLASLPSKTRRDIKAIRNKPVAVRTIDDPAFGPRIDQLLIASFARTGGEYRSRDWAPFINLSKQHPTRSRLVGLFRTDASGPDSLLAFAWGCHHGSHAHYDAGASTRDTDIKLPMAYALIWDLICWARQNGAQWLDLGGIGEGSGPGEQNRLAGIADFKRYFTQDIIDLGGEWALEPRWARARLASAVGAGANLARRWLDYVSGRGRRADPPGPQTNRPASAPPTPPDAPRL